MAIDAIATDSSAVQRAMPREKTSPVVSDGHNGGPVEIRGEMSFWDFLDIINPLQHIPIISNVYREITGDTIQPSMRVMGDMLYGGVVGGMASIANAVIEQATGKDVGDTVMASLGLGGGDHPAAPTDVADASGGPVASGSPAEPSGVTAKPMGSLPAEAPSAGSLAAALAAAKPVSLPPNLSATGQPIRLASAAAAVPGPAQASPALSTQLAADGLVPPHPSKMPARDTPLANSALAKHSAPRQTAPGTGSIMSNARSTGAIPANGNAAAGDLGGSGDGIQAPPANALPAEAGPVPVAPDMLSETMMRNLAKYEQSRKTAQGAGSTMRVSG